MNALPIAVISALVICAYARTAGVQLVSVPSGYDYEVYFDVPYTSGFCAWAEFNDSLSEEGWGRLTVRGNHKDDSIAHYCSGIVEAALTHTRISQYFSVTYDSLLEDLGGSFPQKLADWLTTTIAWTREKAEKNHGNDDYWNAVYSILKRFDGLVDGYKEFRDPKDDVAISELQFVVLEAAGDLDDLTVIVSNDNPELRKKVTSDAWRELHQHCTGLIYMDEQFQDVYVSHDSWSGYNTMNRMLKDYEVVSGAKRAATRWTFSSNAGLLLSMDDFWEMNSGLVVIETTLNTWNTTLYDLYCKPESVLSWIRVNVANLLANNGKQWADTFVNFNSYTYNNQYFIVDTKLFNAGQKPKKGFLTATEQVPGYLQTGDRTDELVQMRWIPSINTPFYEYVYNGSGYPEKVKETQCDYWSYYKCARYLIMDRDVTNKIHTYQDFKNFMRYNDWKNDPLSNQDAAESILSRYDLRPVECIHQGTMTQCPAAFGGIDAKTTNMGLARKLAFDAISSPQYETQPAWEFGTPQWEKVRYDGLPKVWKFPWIQFRPVN